MTRVIARRRRIWALLLAIVFAFIALDVTLVLTDASVSVMPGGLVGIAAIALAIVTLSLLIGVAPRADDHPTAELLAPVRGTWSAINSPGQRLPSHGTRTRGQYSAIDLCVVSSPEDPPLVTWALRPARPEAYAAFGAPVHAMAAGTVHAVHERERDHRARNTWPALLFMLVVEGLLREFGGTRRVVGNHVVVSHHDGTHAMYAHLRKGSVTVVPGQRVEAGDVLGALGNSGNTSMPHLHVQVMDRAEIDAAAGIPLRWTDIELHDALDPQLASAAKAPHHSALEGMPRNGQTFSVRDRGA